MFQSLRVAVILLTHQGSPEPIETSFYQSVASSAAHVWVLEKQSAIAHALASSSTLPWIPQSILGSDLTVRGSVAMIDGVQRALDTEMMQGAVLVACKLVGTSEQVDTCSLRYYDASRRRVVAEAAKTFPVPIDRADPWAEPLVATLARGMVNHTRSQDRAYLDSFLDRHLQREEPTPGTLGIAMGATEPAQHIPRRPAGVFLRVEVTRELPRGFVGPTLALSRFGPDISGAGVGLSLGLLLSDGPVFSSHLCSQWLVLKHPHVTSLTPSLGVHLTWRLGSQLSLGFEGSFLQSLYTRSDSSSEPEATNQDPFQKGSSHLGLTLGWHLEAV